MNKVYISYFYQVRHMNNHLVPFSTALGDPKWFHNFQPKSHVFLDKNNVVNGLRAEELVPGASCNNLCHGPSECDNSPYDCLFLINYYNQLKSIDFTKFSNKIDEILIDYSKAYGATNPIPVFLVHEKPDNPCSERHPLMRWLKENGVECTEFNK